MIRSVLWAVTLARVTLVPVFLMLALRAQDLARTGLDSGASRLAVLAVLAAIGLSDIVDGWIARRFDLATQAGAIVDALADKIVQISVAAFFTFSQGPAFGSLPFWYLGVVVGRDLALGGGWLALRVRRVPFQVVHRPHGRASSVSVFLVLFWLVIGLPPVGLGLLLPLSAVIILASTASYLFDGVVLARRAPVATTPLPGTKEVGES